MILGIDPGISGGLAFTEDKHNSDLFMIPIINGNQVDVNMFLHMLVEYKPDACYIEMPQMRGGNRGLLTSGSNYGRLLGILECQQIKTVPVHARTWGSKIFPDIKGKEKRKQAAIDLCKKNGIDIPYQTKNKLSDGAAESYAISLWGILCE